LGIANVSFVPVYILREPSPFVVAIIGAGRSWLAR
jgi:hypothetical protein